MARPPPPAAHDDLSRFPTSLVGKRILLCAESFGPVNGVSRTTLMLVNHLRSHGVQVAVVAPHNHTNHNTFSPPPSPSMSPVDRQPEVRVTGYPLPFNPELSIVYPVRNSTLYARTFGADAAPDLVYLASPASLGFQVMLQLRQQPEDRQVPVLCNFQTDLSGYCEILFPAPLSHLAVWVLAAVQGYLFRHPSVRTVFYPSRSVRRYLEGQAVPPAKLEVLRRGVDADLFTPARRCAALRRDIAPHGEVVFVTVSRIAGEKGFDFLARAAKAMDARGLAFKLLIVGGNRNPAVEKDVQRLFDPLRASGRVVFAGFKVGQDLAAAYASGDVFLHCSVTETFGLVVLESMASGVPVVARDEGGPSDIVEHGETGYLVAPDDLDAFVDRAVELAGDHQQRFRMARNARRAAEGATWDKINNKVAWRMAHTIDQREREQQQQVAGGHRGASAAPSVPRQMGAAPLCGWIMMSQAARDALKRGVVDARLLGGLCVILACWAFTGSYVFFTECLLWTKGRMGTAERSPVPSKSRSTL
ncbi:GDP-mannose-dependent alpha-mannosyltransferase [Escovopsis weberi]|uniref:GDP-mannose-dependent alpha-mannosyltransferase n=1 Tax=Escovopsis weberi TaxID=150374 RepID=A0A0M9VWE2_ESCWE|nr:GDP-mannose-dependent alpha-mannosyltransferase [Escovopsis weberi]